MGRKLKVTNSDLSYLEEESNEVKEVFDELPEEMVEDSDINPENNDNNIEEEMSVIGEGVYFVSGSQPLVIAGGYYLPNSVIPNAVVEASPLANFYLKNGHISLRNKS